MKVFISTTSFAEYDRTPLNLLKDVGINHDFNLYKRKLTEEEILGVLRKKSYVGLLAGTEPLTKQVLRNANSLKVISRVGVGLDNIDLNTAKKLKIAVYNTPDVLIDSVAELTLGLIICCLRRITIMDKNIHNKIWEKEMGLLLKGKLLGIIGFGRIGKKVAQLARAFGARIIFYDINKIKSKISKQVSLDRLLRKSDIISIHLSSKSRLITNKEILKMKKGTILINTSRGAVIDEDALYNGLKSRKIAFASLDVFKNEPYCGRLCHLDNIILTPHIGSYAREARIRMEIEAVNNLIKGLKLNK